MSRLFDAITALNNNHDTAKIQLILDLQNEINKDKYIISDNNNSLLYWYSIGGLSRD